MSVRPTVLSIAGFDPSAGAGVLADIKTFENIGVYGLGVTTAITYQNDVSFDALDWLETDQIIKQIEILSKRFSFEFVKVGLVRSLDQLQEIVNYLKSINTNCKIIWDPILKATAGFEFHNKIDSVIFKEVCSQLFLITPNLKEAEIIFSDKKPAAHCKRFSSICNVFLKSVHVSKANSIDVLYSDNKEIEYTSSRLLNAQKHGSGCVLSSAITAYLVKGYDLNNACVQAKEYINQFLKSNDTLLGYHSGILKEKVYA